jgi:hypothetical protein
VKLPFSVPSKMDSFLSTMWYLVLSRMKFFD